MNVDAILRNKGRGVITIAPQARIAAAVAMLRRHAIGALVVSSDGTTLEGIVSERDIVVALADRGAAVLQRAVAESMCRKVITCRRDDAIAELAALMTEHRIRHLPVVESGALAGIVSIGDVLKHRIDEVEGEASSMREFIASA